MIQSIKYVALISAVLACACLLQAIAADQLASSETVEVRKQGHVLSPDSREHKSHSTSLLQHLSKTLHTRQTDVIAQEILTLTQGAQWQIDTRLYLSSFDTASDGTRDFINALTLGHWLGTMRSAIKAQQFSKAESAAWFSNLLQRLDKLSNSKRFSAREGLAHDISKNYLTLNEALEILTFGDVTSSTVTTVVGQGIRTAQRHLTK